MKFARRAWLRSGLGFGLVVGTGWSTGCRFGDERGLVRRASGGDSLERIGIAPGGRALAGAVSGRPFRPWGVNYGNGGRLLEDFWEHDWDTVSEDFRKIRVMGFNVVRIHLQVGRFMDPPGRPNPGAMGRFARLVQLAEATGLYLDVTGLACYRPADSPAWYDALEEPARWSVQAEFWAAIAAVGARSPAVFCYDLMNEPISPAQRRDPGQWRSGNLFGGYDFVQYIALDPAGRSREEIARAWIRRMTEAIRRHDRRGLITVGLLPWSRSWKHLSGFVPASLAGELDFISVHIYPDRGIPDEAMEALRMCAVGRPVVIEETFPLSCDLPQFEAFLRASRELACGWLAHYDGVTPEEADTLEVAGRLTMSQAVYRAALRSLMRLRSEFAP